MSIRQRLCEKRTHREDYEKLVEIISEEVKLSITLDHHFKFFGFADSRSQGPLRLLL